MTDQKGRILVLFGSIPLYGHERGNIDVMEALRERGWEVLFVIHDEWGHLHIQPELERRGFDWVAAPFVDRFERGMGVRGWVRRLSQIARGSMALKRVLRQFRPTHIHLGHPIWYVSFLPVLESTRIPVVYRVGDAPAVHRRLFRWLWRWGIGRRVNRFVCISRFVCRELAASAGVAGKSLVIYSRPPGRQGKQEELLPLADKSSLTFVYVGQITEEKGVGLIVEAAMQLCAARDDVRFLLAGDYSWRNPFAEALLESTRQRGLAERVVLLGYIDDVDRLLAASDVHLCPSLWEEPLGLTVLEAKRAGIPSVVFPSGGLPELIVDGVDGVVCRKKTASCLHDACERYLKDGELCRLHGRAARASLARLCVDDFAARWDEVYSGVSRG